MSAAARWRLVPIAVLLGVYGLRAVGGMRAGWELDRGHLLRNTGDYTASAPRLEAAVVGSNASRALIMAGEVRLDEWEKQVRRRGALGANPQELVHAARNFLTCRCVAPAARGAWKGLGEVYDAFEWIGRERRSEEARPRSAQRWERVGRPGRIASGLLRGALEVSENWGALHDRLALTLWNYGLEEEARQAVRRSARALPLYYGHPYYKIPELPRWVDVEFAAASREVLGQVPLFPRTAHLIDLGKLERRLGEDELAIAALEEALAAGGDALRIAEASFHLGLALIAVERHADGLTHMQRAREHPVFRPSALRALASLAVRQGDLASALEYLRELRRENPGDLGACLEFASVAARLEDWPAAFESLGWARLRHSRDPRPYAELARLHLERREFGTAVSVADELEQVVGPDSPDLARLRREIAGRAPGGAAGG